jgi:hypothetical protein
VPEDSSPEDNPLVRSEDQDDTPSVRQLLHAATGDRDAEAKALADRSPDDISEDDAKLAVEIAHRDVHANAKPERDVASPDDAEAVADSEVVPDA